MNNTFFLKRQNLLLATLLMVFMVGLSSCSQDDDEIYDNLIGYTWVGDLGFDFNDYPVESGITFKGDGYAVDRQYFMDNGDYATTLNLVWNIEYGTLFLDYVGSPYLFEIRNVFVGSTYLSGSLYLNGGLIDSNFQLERWN